MVQSRAMTERQESTEERRRDEMLRRLLKTPPQPRPDQERDKGKPTWRSVKRATAEKPEPSA